MLSSLDVVHQLVNIHYRLYILFFLLIPAKRALSLEFGQLFNEFAEYNGLSFLIWLISCLRSASPLAIYPNLIGPVVIPTIVQKRLLHFSQPRRGPRMRRAERWELHEPFLRKHP